MSVGEFVIADDLEDRVSLADGFFPVHQHFPLPCERVGYSYADSSFHGSLAFAEAFQVYFPESGSIVLVLSLFIGHIVIRTADDYILELCCESGLA